MENAGRSCAEIVLQRFSDHAAGGVTIVCGRGNNGGDGFVIARHLSIAGVEVRTFLIGESARLTGDALANFRMAEACGISIESIGATSGFEHLKRALSESGCIVDAILGTGFSGGVRPPIDEIIDLINDSKNPVLAVDVPSGLDCQAGKASSATVRAELTVTFVAPKPGLLMEESRPYVGELQISHIGLPPGLVDEALRASAAG